MKKLIILFILLALNSCEEKTKKTNQENQVNIELKEQLEHILTLDQGIRQLLQENISETEKAALITRLGLHKKTVETNIYGLMKEIDSTNLIEVEKIIQKYGYPSKTLVGEPANETVFYVIQHSNKIEQYLPIIKKAAEKGDISKKKLAMMEDRYLMHNGQEQIYGTQIRGQKDKDGNWVHFVWPIKNPVSVNRIREKIGLENIEAYAKKFDIDYKVLTLEEINDL
ncbi:DUF6624 domain-containing protein [Formosa sp. A9]|uniref:DUF6624 domain-containing protein n=1 Tax=Formosa sp. A9 TaxID=3442641 RepID=UPI003EBC500F